MIINIRGTSGSGKSTLVRMLMVRYRSKNTFRIEGRKQPIGYVCGYSIPGQTKALAVIGHYETVCGGCDTIQKMDNIFELVRRAHDNGNHVVFEGLLISADVNRTLALHTDELPLTVIALDRVDLETCFDGINKRRRERMGEKFTPVARKNTESKFKGVQKSMERLEAAGVATHHCDREDAEQLLLELVGLNQ